ncbi:MAG: peptide chain release factor N(5)-glutamine methyltransferase [Thermodesulfobacteriota bacterium]
MTILDLLNWSTNYLGACGIENPRLNAELLLAHSLHLSREGLYTHLMDPSGKEVKKRLEPLIHRRVCGEPLQYILGDQEFWSIRFRVDPRVLIPRPETELLVGESLSVLSVGSLQGTPYVLEIGTGSGAIAISLAKEVRDLFIVATDISGEALLLARENAMSAGVHHRITFVKGDLFGPFRSMKGKGSFHLILSNPPYIQCSEIQNLPREIKDYEPLGALNGGTDGMAFHRRIICEAPAYLRKEGWLLLEVGEGQAKKVSAMIEEVDSFSRPQRIRDLSGIERVVKAQIRR